jgi:hypothetical protein
LSTLSLRHPSLDVVVIGSVGGLAVAGLVAILLGNGNLGVALAPLALTGLVLAVALNPLRRTLYVVAFLALVLENPAEGFAEGAWQSPIAPFGQMMLMQLKATFGAGLIVSGLDLCIALVATVLFLRRLRGSRIDLEGQVPAAAPIVGAAFGCLATIAFVWGLGMARGGSFGDSLWQIFRVIYLPTVVLLFAATLRGGRDAGVLATLLVIAAMYRAGLAIYIRMLFPDTEKYTFTTTHADSMLFATAFSFVLAYLYERPGKRSALIAAASLPLLSWGMIANNRRLVWVELIAALVALAFLTGWSPIKRRLSQAAVLASPLLLLYVAAGWSRPTGVFAPVKTLRSVVDSGADQSTRWRDYENYNLYETLKKSPIVGSGFGVPYEEVVHLPDISAHYELYRLAPHNAILGILAYGGLLGFAGLFMMIPLGVFLAARVYRRALAARDRIASLTAIAAFVIYLMHCYGDMALGTYTSVWMLGPLLALVGKMATATDAWPTPAPPMRHAPSA